MKSNNTRKNKLNESWFVKTKVGKNKLVAINWQQQIGSNRLAAIDWQQQIGSNKLAAINWQQ